MRASFRKSHFAAWLAVVSLGFAIPQIYGQAAGNSGSIAGTVTDPTGAVVPNATVEIRNLVSQYDRITTTDGKGIFRFSNVPFNPYHVTVPRRNPVCLQRPH
jgi:Carboxypeptidase regulatory-like domain